MVGIVVVSHSQCLAEGAVELAKLMAGNARIAAAGGLEDGTPGTSFEKIMTAIESVYSEDGVAVLMDMGSAVMTTEMVIESLGYDNVFMLDALCPAYDAMRAAVDAGEDMKSAVAKAVEAARAGVEYTKTIKATKGRASYIGDRSIGHQDPGATSALYMLEVLLEQI